MAEKTLQHLAIIMDGNRRWARAKGLPTIEGHRQGYKTFKKVGEWCLEKGIKILTVYAFSTENWRRSKEEVNYLMGLLEKALTEEISFFQKKGIQVKIIGRLSDFSQKLQQAIQNIEEKTKQGIKGRLNIALSYGGRAEIVEAIKKIARQKIPAEKITEKTVEENLYTAGLPDPEMVIRTSGEQRLSGFLLWQSSYSELYFTPTLWPDFSREDLEKAIQWFQSRQRRFGGN